MSDSTVVRYLLVELEIADGSGNAPDPDDVTTAIRLSLSGHLYGNSALADYYVGQVFPGTTIATD